MTRLRASRIAFTTLVLAGALGGACVAIWGMPGGPKDDNVELEAQAAHRFQHVRGLTPCDRSGEEIIELARRGLETSNVANPQLIAVVAPTFGGAEVAAFGVSSITVVRFSGDTGYTPVHDWFSNPIAPPLEVAVPAESYQALVTPLFRHVRYAMTAPRAGLDGASYFLSWREECAYMWSPRHDDGPSSAIGEMLRTLQEESPSVEKLLELSREIDRLDSGAAG